jgi:hypothetical protein
MRTLYVYSKEGAVMVDFERLARERYDRYTPEERAWADSARERRRVDEGRSRVQVVAERTSCTSGAMKSVDVTLVVRPSSRGALYLHVEGGPTGYESMPYENLKTAVAAEGWAACNGTQGRWDRLFVPRASLKMALDFFEPLHQAEKLA